MNTDLTIITETLCEILDVEPEQVRMETYIMRDLGAESIDLLELAVTFSDRFKTEVTDDEIFLKSLRIHIEEAEAVGVAPAACLEEKYPFLSPSRISEILADLDDGPVLKVKDLLNYMQQKAA